MNARSLLVTMTLVLIAFIGGFLFSTGAIRDALASLRPVQADERPRLPMPFPVNERGDDFGRLVDVLREDREALRNELADLHQRLDAARPAAKADEPPAAALPVEKDDADPAAPVVEPDVPATPAEARARLQRYLVQVATAKGFRVVRFTQRTPALTSQLRQARMAGGHQPFYYPRNAAEPRLFVDLYVDVANRTVYYRPEAADRTAKVSSPLIVVGTH